MSSGPSSAGFGASESPSSGSSSTGRSGDGTRESAATDPKTSTAPGAKREAETASTTALARSDRAARRKREVLLVRDTTRTVIADDEVARARFRLALACACAVGAIIGVWLLGHLGFRLGAAPALGVPELLAEPGEGLATGTALLLRVPISIYRLALHEPLLVVLGFAAMAIPAAGLAAARPMRRGGPRPPVGVVALATLGVIVGIAVGVALVAWTLSPWRAAALPPLPAASADIAAWATTIDHVVGLDALALITLILWCVLMPRLAAPQWLRLLGTVLVLCAAAIGLVGTAMSGASAAHAHLPRSVVRLDSGSDAVLVGYTRQQVVLLRDVDGTAMIGLVSDPGPQVVTDRASIVEALAGRTGRGERGSLQR